VRRRRDRRRSIASSAVERRVDADRDVGSVQVVVDRRSDADDLQAHLRQRERAGLRSVAPMTRGPRCADLQIANGLLAHVGILEPLEARAA